MGLPVFLLTLAPPVLGQERLERADLLLELRRCAALQGHLVPDHPGGGGRCGRHQVRRLGIIEIGQDQHRRRMFVEPVRKLFQREAHVLQADLLADDVERQRLETLVHAAHDAGQDRAVAHARVEQADGRRAWMDVGEFLHDPFRHHSLLAAGVDEHQVFLPVVVEAEILLLEPAMSVVGAGSVGRRRVREALPCQAAGRLGERQCRGCPGGCG